ncbi:MAG: FkbM family methyltransferase [Actinomycetota bacterium]|nr:FkbM family methyltransferase [Actinomycetota bacterium]
MSTDTPSHTPAAPAAAARVVSYAQNAEDMVLRRAFGDRTEGFYIDVGANHPVNDSVTKHFYDLGWRGINIEPVLELHAQLSQLRPLDINLCVGVGAEPGTLEFAEVSSNQGLSTFNAKLDANNAAAGQTVVHRSVPITTLADVCRQHVTGEIDFLKVDVEGFEAQVFLGHDWATFRPKVILAEDNFSSDWHDLVQSHGYTQTLHDGLNRFYVRNDLLPELGPRLNRPAVLAIDGFDPWLYVSQLQQLHARVSGVPAQDIDIAAPPGPSSIGRRLLGRVLRSPIGRVARPLARTRTVSRLRSRLG